ncbi:MAG TPA: prefoldin subunit beta [Candidatus Aenigmarchaeota archaeon]|nr:prefoldin subunit beta [Candidatus Aenigmarchaeota archaeon]
MVSQHVQQLLTQAQVYQQQIQAILTQKESLNIQVMEIKKALEEIDKSKEAYVYRAAGPVLVKEDKSEAKKYLSEKQESIELRLKSLEKTEKLVKDKLEDLRGRLAKHEKSESFGG